MNLQIIVLCYQNLIVFGCSLMTHTEIGERARRFFGVISQDVDYNRLIRKHQDAFQAGAPYPDAFYPGICFGGNYHDIAEDSHWTPFIKAAVDYIQRHYPRPWSLDAERLIVFLLGVVQHQVADATWHSLGIEQGFLDTMGKINYNGSFSRAHTDGDFGGDVLNVYQMNMNYVGQIAKWYVPVEDLMNIYTDMYGADNPMSPEIIETCTQLLFLGRLGESIGAIDVLYPLYAQRSPFLLDRLHDYFLGGVDDMAVWTQNVWKRVVYMLDHSTSNCSLPDNPIYIRCDYESSLMVRKADKSLICAERAVIAQKWFSLVSQFADKHSMQVEHTEKGILLSPSVSALRSIKRREMKSGREISACHSEQVDPPQYFYSTNLEYSRLGQFMTSGDINNDGYTDVIISAPGYSSGENYQQGRVYIIYGLEGGIPIENKILEQDADQVLDGVEVNGRFGSSAVVIDVNCDGLSDLVVSAPSVGSDSLDYYGRVYVYLSSSQGQALPNQPDLTIGCTERYCNLGTVLTSGDVNGDGFADLIVGSPYAGAGGRQRGMVGIIYASARLRAGTHLSEADFDWRVDGEQDYDWAGYSVSCGQTGSGGVILVVGSPEHRICARSGCQYDVGDIQAAGKVLLFTISSPSSEPLPSEYSQVFVGTEEFQQIGMHVTVARYNNRYVVILTSPGADASDGDTVTGRAWKQAGRVEFFSLLDDGTVDFSQAILTLSGSRDYGRFGSNVLVYDSNGSSVIFVTSPLRSEDFFEDREGGRVYLYTSDSLTEHKANKTLGIFTAKSRFGSSLSLVSTPNSGRPQVFIGGEHYNRVNGVVVNRLLGIVGVYQL